VISISYEINVTAAYYMSENRAITTTYIPDEKERRQLPFLSLLHLHASCVTLILLHQRNLGDHTIVPAIYEKRNAEHVTHENSKKRSCGNLNNCKGITGVTTIAFLT
jgi:hypothetical protein